MTPTGPQALGRLWEARAAEYLEGRGLKIIARGYRCRLGELDIVGTHQGTLVVIEVRARRQTQRGSAVETVAGRKQRKIVQATRHFLMRNPQWFEQPIRFDVFAIDEIDTEHPRFNWIRNAFGAG